MAKSISSLAKSPTFFANFSSKKYKNPFPNFTLEERLSPKLVGYARILSRVSFFKKSLSLDISDKYLEEIWSDETKISRSTVQRRLSELQKAGIIFISTSDPEKLPDGSFRQQRTINLIPIQEEEPKQKKKFSGCVSKMIHQDNYLSNDRNRTIQNEEKSDTSFIDTTSLKKIEPEKKQNPDDLVRRLQKSFLKKAIKRIIEDDSVDYRFMCLLLRTCLGANDKTVGYYGRNLHIQLRYKPELVTASLDLMVKSYSQVKKPVGFLIAELQASLGKANRKQIQPQVRVQEPLPLPNRDVPLRKRRNLEELQEKFDAIRKEKLNQRQEQTKPNSDDKLPITKKDFREVLQVLRSPRGLR